MEAKVVEKTAMTEAASPSVAQKYTTLLRELSVGYPISVGESLGDREKMKGGVVN